MANTTIKITQLQNIGNGLAANTLLPVVNTAGTAITQKVTVGNVANFVMSQAGTTLAPAFLSNLAYSVVNAAQPNITSVGTLNVNTLKISGGVNGYVLQTDGAGNLSWSASAGGGNGTPGGANSQIQFNDNGLFAGATTLTFDAGTYTLNTVNIAASSATIYDNIAAGNLTTSGSVVAENVEANNISVNNIELSGNIEAPYFIGNGSQLTGIVATASGAGPNTSVQFNDDGVFAGDANFTYDSLSETLSASNVASQNLTVSDVATIKDISVSGNISGALNISASFLVGDGSLITNLGNAARANVANNANIANTANSVAVANVVGIGNIAVLSLSGSSSNILYGNGTFAPGYANSNVIGYLGNLNTDIIPDTDETYDLGSPSKRFKSLYLSGNTLYLGDVSLSANNTSNSLVIGNTEISSDGAIISETLVANSVEANLSTSYGLPAANVTGLSNVAISGSYTDLSNTPTLGNIASINLDGSSSNVLYGNGLWGTIPIPNAVANANYASYAGTSNVANSVAGSNVTGQVSYAAVANSVAVANVVGIGNIATINRDGSSSNVLYGNGIFAPIVSPYGNSNVATFLASFGSNTITTTGNISVGNISGNTNGFAVGYRDIPQVSFAANATTALSDAGKHYYSTSSSNLVLTIANNSSIAFNLGATINIINQGTGNITIAQGTGVTLYLAGNSTSANRTLTSYGVASITKVATDTWFLSGVGVA